MSLPQNAAELIPQAPPFMMIDELIYTDERKSRTTFMIADDNVMVTNGHLTGGGLLENMAQTAAARAGYKAKIEGKPVQSGYIGAVKDMEVNFLPPVGSWIITEITETNQVFNVTVVKGKVWYNSLLAASCEMKLFLNEEE